MSGKVPLNRYSRIIQRIFESHYRRGLTEFEFRRSEIREAAENLGIESVENLGDLVYSFRYRGALPKKIRDTAPEGEEWIILPAGRALYRFTSMKLPSTTPTEGMAETKVPDATPGVIEMHAMTDEQALLAKLRYNRLIDIFTGITCYSLQNHLRTSVREVGQVETDEIYIGIDRRGAHFVIPVQAKAKKERIGIVQIWQDFRLSREKFGALIARPVSAQFMADNLIAMFEYEEDLEGISLTVERHYRLVPAEDVEVTDLQRYGSRPS